MKSFGQTYIYAADYGLKPGSFENASPAIFDAIEACRGKNNTILVLPGGRIDLWPEGAAKRELYISNSTENDTLLKIKNIGFLFENLKNFTLEGNNTHIILHGKMISFAVLKSENIQIQNLSFDYERPSMSEFTIRSVSDYRIETEVHKDSKYLIEDGKITFYGEGWKTNSYHTILVKPNEGVLLYSTFEPFLKSKAIESSPFHISFSGDFSKTDFKTGDILTIRDPYRDNCGGFINMSEDVVVENVHMYYMHGLGIVSQFSENISMIKVIAAPDPNSGRMIASFADCFHFSGCKGQVLLDGCITSGSHDDPVNIHGTHLKITAIKSNNIVTVRFMHHQTYGFEAFHAGDSITFVSPETLLPLASSLIKSAKLINNREMELEISTSLPENLQTGDCIENITWTPSVIIRNCRFERTNTRGLLLTTRRKVLIENNTFSRTGMHAILISDDASSWYESGAVQDVTIRNNTFNECGYNSSPGNYIIAISPENHDLIQGKPVHRNIIIEHNLFKVYDYPLLTARSCDNLVFRENTVTYTDFMKRGKQRPAFTLTACKNVVIQENMFPFTETPEIECTMMTRKDIKTHLETKFVK